AAIIPRQGGVRSVAPGTAAQKLALYKPIKPQPALLPPPVPTVRKRHDASSWAAGALAASSALDTAAHGLFRPATDQRPRARLDLRPDRDRLHDGLRHRRHDQFRPWRYFHDRRLHRPDHLPDPGLVRPDRHPPDPADRAFGIDGDHGALRLDGGAHRLPAAAALVPPGADALGDRHVIRADQFFAGSPGRARKTSTADHHRRAYPA